MFTFHDGSLNDTHMDVMHLEKIDDEEDQEQYDAYLKWLDEYGITEKQLQDALESYASLKSKHHEHCTHIECFSFVGFAIKILWSLFPR